MEVTITQTRKNGQTETLVSNFPLKNDGDLAQAIEIAKEVSIQNDGAPYPKDLDQRDIRITS